MAKRVMAILIAVMMIVPTALSSVIASGNPTISASQVTVAPGESGTISVSIANNPGVMAIEIKLQYDSSVITAGTVSAGDLFGSVSQRTQSYGLRVSVEDSGNIVGNGVIFTLPFTVDDNAECGTYTIGIVVNDAYDEGFEDVTFTVQDGAVCVEETPADYPDVTFTAQSVTVNASNIASFRQQDGSFIVPVSVTVSGISADNGIAAFTLTPSSNATVSSVAAGSAIYDDGQFLLGDDNKMAWVDMNEITADNSEVAVVCLAIPHNVAAGASYTLTLTPSSDPDDFLFIDLSNYDPIVVNATVSFAVSGHVAGTAANENVVAATCTAGGSYDEVVRCTICSAVLSSTHHTTSALGHSYGDWTVTTPATCTEAGVESRVCSRDASHVETRPIAALGHNFGDWTVTTPATCTAAGVESRVCSRDASHVETRPIAATGHTFVNGVCTSCGEPDPNYVDPDDPTTPRFVLSSATVAPGGTVRLTIEVVNNPGFATVTAQTNYNKTLFTTGSAIAGVFGGVTKGTVGAGNRWVFANDYNVEGDGVLVSFDLTASSDVAPGEYPITLVLKEVADENLDDVIFKAVSAVITVAENNIIYGDVNDDGIVNGKDAVLVMQYVSNYDDDTETSSIVFPNPDAADVNNDGVVNGRDAVLIKQYVANYDDDTGISTIVLGPHS